MRTRFVIALLACATLIPASGCGSCRWGRKHGALPYQCVDPHCDDPACEVCSPVPPLYDGWANHRYMHGSGCSCGGMPCGNSCGSCCEGGMVTGDCGSCGNCEGGMVMDGTCEMTGNSCGMPSFGGGDICPHCHQSTSMPPQEPGQAIPQEHLESAPTYEPQPSPAPATPMGDPSASASSATLYSPPPTSFSNSVPMPPPGQIPSVPAESLAPEPPTATPTSATRPSNYFFAPNKPLTRAAAPRPLTGPVRLTPTPTQWETKLEVEHLEQASLALPDFDQN
jgi:hypothetical protein